MTDLTEAREQAEEIERKSQLESEWAEVAGKYPDPNQFGGI